MITHNPERLNGSWMAVFKGGGGEVRPKKIIDISISLVAYAFHVFYRTFKNSNRSLQKVFPNALYPNAWDIIYLD